MKKHINLSSYNGIENLNNFNNESFKKYCKEKIISCSDRVKYIKENCCNNNSNWSGKICEIGSGNSKLLYNLEKNSLLEEGIGFEISKSRYLFAEKFKKYVNSQKVKNINDNFLLVDPLTNYDLVIAVDNAFQIITPLSEDAEYQTLNWISETLKTGGYLLLELWNCDNYLEMIKLSDNRTLRIWESFEKNDPWEYMLCEIKINRQKDLLWKKFYKKRNSNEQSESQVIIRPYSINAISKKLKKFGFKILKPKSKESENFFNNRKGEYYILAQKDI